MPLIISNATALPYLDAQSDSSALSAADALIKAEMASVLMDAPHHSLPSITSNGFSPAMNEMHLVIANGQSSPKPIDLSRYEALDAPDAGDLSAWQSTLRKAYVSAEYMRSRETNLSLLEAYGKNAWLISNSGLEDILRDLEKDLDAAKVNLQQIESERKTSQEAAAGELHGLESTWRKGIARMLETQAAAESLRQEILLRKRA